MDDMIRQAAEAFSHHQFASSYDRLHENIRWRNVGGDEHIGKAAVIAACEAATTYLAGVRTTFTASRTTVADHTVVVETSADYLAAGDSSTVTSCDVYDVADGRITVITSYNVET